MMKQIADDIKNRNFQRVYLLYGEEDYLKAYYANMLIEALVPERREMNLSRFEGECMIPREMISMSETLPFFAEKRVILIENSGVFKSAFPEVADYIRKIPETTVWIFKENQVDKRGRAFKGVRDAGRQAEFPRQDEKTLVSWIGNRVKAEGYTMERGVPGYLLEKVGVDMMLLSGEMEKLYAYTCEKKHITREAVDALCTAQAQNRVFDLMDAVAARDPKKALAYYGDLLTLKEPPMRILYLLARHYRILFHIRELKKGGMDRAGIARAVKVPPFAVGKYLRQCEAFSGQEMIKALNDMAGYEEMVKTGRMNDQLSVEILIIENSRPKKSRGENSGWN